MSTFNLQRSGTNDWSWLRRCAAIAALWAALVIITTGPALAQQNDDAAAFTDAELEEMVGRIALFPDDLIGVVLPASTFPLQIVQAARYLDDYEDDPDLEPDPAWDDSVVALLNYPEVVRQLDEDLDWTWNLGAAVLEDQSRVLDAIQEFRDRAYAAGNLASDDRQIVTRDDDEVIEIRPADPEVIYVPVYEPRRVVVYSPSPVIRYYPWSYPVYYYPYPAGFTFGHSYRSGFFWGVTSAFSIGWRSHHVHVYHHDHLLHPYYARRHYYGAPHFARRSVHVHLRSNAGQPVWRPREHHGIVRGRVRPERPVRVSRDGYVNDRRVYSTRRSVSQGGQREVQPAVRSNARQRAPVLRRDATRPGTSRADRPQRAAPGSVRPTRSAAGDGASSRQRAVPQRDAQPGRARNPAPAARGQPPRDARPVLRAPTQSAARPSAARPQTRAPARPATRAPARSSRSVPVQQSSPAPVRQSSRAAPSGNQSRAPRSRPSGSAPRARQGISGSRDGGRMTRQR